MSNLALKEYQRESLDAIGRFCDAVRAAVGVMAKRLGFMDRPLFLWVTPSTTIRDQTLNALKNRRHPYRAARRESTERPITAELGSNRIVGTNPKNIIAAFNEAMSSQARQPGIPPLWDGQAAQRIVKVLAEKLC